MREVNFSIPNVNKASVGITTALYDRRALDCTSTLPLINSLNHLAYLTTSSARIRDILTVDGGIERLVGLLKAGRSPDMMDMWKWNLAFQCIVNIGVRGSENVRTRVVEADMVPVIATILDNYVRVFERCRDKAEQQERLKAALGAKTAPKARPHATSITTPPVVGAGASTSASFGHRVARFESEFRASRRHPPPPAIEIPTTGASPTAPTARSERLLADAMDITPAPALFATTSPPERTSFGPTRAHPHADHAPHRHHHHHHHHHHLHHRSFSRPHVSSAGGHPRTADEGILRPVRDADRLPSMLSEPSTGGVTSQPESPTTPLPPTSLPPTAVAPSETRMSHAGRRRPSIRHQASTMADLDEAHLDSLTSDESAEPEVAGVPEVQTVDIQDMSTDDMGAMLASVETPLGLTPPMASEVREGDAFNMTHRSTMRGSMGAGVAAPTTAPIGLSPVPPPVASPPNMPPTTIPRYLLDRPTPPPGTVLAAMPRDEDVLLSLQLLAYVSKYCNLRSYFQQSHLVPKLQIGAELGLLDTEDAAAAKPAPAADVEEHLLPDDFNIFPLVEKFTVRHHSHEMQYWAGVVMRNLCRKDETRGGIRQCAYYQCGKWEEMPRQFAKCRRCRRTKYCSKECQKSAWVFHRHWCVAAQNQSEGTH